MLRRLLHLAFLVLLVPAMAAAQITPTITVAYGHNTIDEAPLNQFFDSFNTFWGDQVAEPFETLDATAFAHMEYGGGLRALFPSQGLGVTLATNAVFGRAEAKRQMRYVNGMGHDLEMHTRDIGWDFHLGLTLGKHLLASGIAEAYIRDLTYLMYTRFQNGSRSLGNVYKIAGVYTGTATTFDIGFGAGLKLGPLLFTAKWMFPMSNFPPGQEIVTLDDYDTDEFPPTDFPVNYELWATDPVQFAAEAADGQEVALLTDRMRGMRFTFGVELLLGALF